MRAKFQAGRPRRGRLIAVALVVASAVGLDPPAASGGERRADGPPDTFVTNWDAVGAQAFTAAGLTPAEGFPIFAYVAIAVYDAVMAVRARTSRSPSAPARPGASADAAVVAAAHRIFEHYLPTQEATILDPAYDASLATIPDGQAEDGRCRRGVRVANAFIALRADDGFREAGEYTPPDPPRPGVWVPTAATPPLGTYLGLMQPFGLESADQFRPDGPPSLGSRRWARDYNEVKEIGSRTSTTRTAEQTPAACSGESHLFSRRAAPCAGRASHGSTSSQAARMMAMVSVAYADGIIACFDAKYDYKFWRPITAIRTGDKDGNGATVVDPAWMPLLGGTPNHPDYPSAHSCITPAGGEVMAEFLGTRHIDLTCPA